MGQALSLILSDWSTRAQYTIPVRFLKQFELCQSWEVFPFSSLLLSLHHTESTPVENEVSAGEKGERQFFLNMYAKNSALATANYEPTSSTGK